MLDAGRVEFAIAASHLHQYRLGPAGAALEVLHGICRHQLTFVDDDHLLTRLFDFGKDVRAENDAMFAAQAPDEVARLVDLLGVETGGGVVKDERSGWVT